MSEHEIIIKKCSDMSTQPKICSDNSQNDLTLVPVHIVVIHFGLDVCQIKLGFVQVNTKSVQNVRYV